MDIEKRSKHLTRFVTKDGGYCFEHLTFSLKSRLAYFQRIVKTIVDKKDVEVITYLDGINAYGNCP